MQIFTVTQPKRLDEIVFQYYGTLQHLTSVIEDNQHLINKVVLDVGDKVNLGEFEVVPSISKTKTLWD